MLKSKGKTAFSAMNGLAVALTALLTLELYFVLRSPDDQAAPVSVIAAHAVGLQTGDSSDPQTAIAAWQSVVLGRPLFDPSRRPPAVPSQAAASPAIIPRLSGIMITPTERIAVFSPDMGGPIIVAENSHFGAFTVLSISGDSVTVKGPNGVIVLRSNFSYQGGSGKSAPNTLVLPGGIDLDLIKVPLPSAATWPGTQPLR